MSLTSHLKQLHSPVYRFFPDHFPNSGSFAGQVNERLRSIPTIRPSGKVPYGTIGTALDYRLRYYFTLTPIQKLVAWHGAGQLCGRPINRPDDVEVRIHGPNAAGEPILSEELVDKFFVSLQGFVNSVHPPRKRLERDQEELIARYCIVLALFEEEFRAWGVNSPLFEQECHTVDALLAIAQPQWVDDLCKLSWLFYDQFSDLLSASADLNPTFDGSSDIGGADADLILDRYLLDIKTTVSAKIKPQWLYQLIGYVLLDYTDRYQLRGVGFYMARQGLLLKWTLPEFLKGMTREEAPSLVDLRLHFRELLHEIQQKCQEAERKRLEQQEWEHRQLQAKWARQVVRMWQGTDPQALPKRQRKSLDRAIKLLEQYEQEKAQRSKRR